MGRKKINYNDMEIDASQPIEESKGMWEKFSQNIVGGMDLGDSYINAGYKAKTKDTASVCANNLLKNPKIANRIAYLKKAAADAMIADVTEVLRSMTAITRINPIDAMENMRKYGRFVDGVEFETKKIKDEDGEVIEKRIIKKIKMVSKAKMYELIGRYYSMFTDNVNVIDKTPLHQKLAERLIESGELEIDKLFEK